MSQGTSTRVHWFLGTHKVQTHPLQRKVRRRNKMGHKPRLPREIEQLLPMEIVRQINKFVPKLPKPATPSPGLQRELERLQRSPARNAMDLYGLDDFVLR